MKYKLLGRSGLRVSEICLGTMTFGEEWGWGNNKEISEQVFNGFAEAGGNFIDTANSYTNGTSEPREIQWLFKGRPAKPVRRAIRGRSGVFNQNPPTHFAALCWGGPHPTPSQLFSLVQRGDASNALRGAYWAKLGLSP